MTKTKAMLATHPGELSLDPALLAECIDACLACVQRCSGCADACLAEEAVADLRRCIRLDLDCADVCAATARLLSRQTQQEGRVLRAQLQACIEVTRVCKESCQEHADRHEHCRVCAEACERCETLCGQVLGKL